MLTRINRRCFFAIVLPLVSLGGVAHTESFSLEETCLQAFPDDIQARLDIQSILLESLPPNDSDFSIESVFTIGKSWNAGAVITVAFRGGSYELRESIMDLANAWTVHANLSFDFGHDEANESFREWNPTDTSYAADIRVGFDQRGNWSFVGTDSINSFVAGPGFQSLNLGGFDILPPYLWKSTVIHEFGHAIGFQHEHQHPGDGCDDEFRWNNDAGYIPTTDANKQYVPDSNKKRPGIYLFLGGPPNSWPKEKIDRNLRQLKDSHRFEVGPFDKMSIMKYYFPSWMFLSEESYCYTDSKNTVLSQGDKEAAQRAYPGKQEDVDTLDGMKIELFQSMIDRPALDGSVSEFYQERLKSLQ